MFEELGLNVAPQPDNGGNPRPDNRSGWLEGETPDVVSQVLTGARGRTRHPPLGSGLATALLAQARRAAAPGRRPNTARVAATREPSPSRASDSTAMIEIEARLDELEALGLYRRTRLISGPQGPHVLLDGKPVLLLCSNNYLGLADHPRVRRAAAEAAMRWGAGAGASRLVFGNDDDPPPARGAAGRVQASRGGVAVRLRVSGQRRHGRRSGPTRRCCVLRRAQSRIHHRRLPALTSRGVRLRPLRRRAPRSGGSNARRAAGH